MLFSHGYGGVRWQSPYIGEHLASHGWIVVAPDHPLNTYLDDDDSAFDEVAVRRPIDIRDSYDWLLSASDDAQSPYAGCADAAAGYAVSGHSFGGYTAFAVAGAPVTSAVTGEEVDLSDSRAWAVVGMAPWNGGGLLGDGMASIAVPEMALSGDLDESTRIRQVQALQDALTVEPRHFGEFARAGHYSFSPVACQAGQVGGGCGDGYIDLDVFTGLVQTALAAFLEESRGVSGAIDQLPEDPDELGWTSVP
jgi:predicted dienelactone hydrolase